MYYDKPQKAKLLVKKLIFEQNGEFTIAGDEKPRNLPKFKIYLAEYSPGNPPIFLFSEEPIELGDYECSLKKFVEWETYLYNDKAILSAFMNAYPEALKAPIQAEIKHAANSLDYFLDVHNILKKYVLSFGFYLPSPKLTKQEILDIGQEKIKEYTDMHLRDSYTVDPRIEEWAKSGLIRFPNNEESTRYMKYRDHSLIVKNSKSGVTQISRRTNANIDQLTEASAEGWADTKGNIRYSVFHNDFHAKNIDEVLQVREEIMGKLYSFMETGEYTAMKAAYKIINRGAPKITFTANPSTLHKKPQESTYYETSDSLGAFTQVLSHLTTTPEAAMSRFGRIIFANNIERAQRIQEPYEDIEIERANDAIKSLFEHLKIKVAQIYQEQEKWLNKPITGYMERIRTSIIGFDDRVTIAAWTGQEGAYKHIRGGALASAIVDNAYDLLQDTANIDKIIEDANAETQNICERNLQSLRNLLEATKQELTPEKLLEEVNHIEPRYYKPILYAIFGLPGERLSEQEIIDYLNGIDESQKIALFGKEYAFWSAIKRVLGTRATDLFARRTKLRFGFETSLSPTGMLVIHKRPTQCNVGIQNAFNEHIFKNQESEKK